MIGLRYFIFNKPFGYLSQFTNEGKYKGLGELKLFPPDVYSIGRLDADSEGLLIITNDKSLNQKLLHPTNEHVRTYHAQVEGNMDEFAINELKRGVLITVNGGYYTTKPCEANVLKEKKIIERNPPIRDRKTIPTSWVELKLTEGKNRQVRKMTAAVGYPTLRLIRVAIENLELGKLQPGQAVEIDKKEIYSMLKIEM